MYTIMENPVILPTSKISIDLATIKSHLLSDPTDPFNRSPLKIEDVFPGMSLVDCLILDDKLKAEIAAFRKEKRGKKDV
jgi:ubiquitin conjugation factor E4 B